MLCYLVFAGSCFEGQHKIHAAVAAVTFVLYAVVSIMMVRIMQG